MKKFGQAIALPFIFLLLFSPYIGILFSLSLVVAMIGSLLFQSSGAATFLFIGLKFYFWIGVFTFALLTTFEFQHCCVGFQTFRNHLKHRGYVGVIEDIVTSLVWPACWFGLDRNLRGWGLTFGDIVLNALEYWFVSSWRGVSLISINIKTGEVEKTRIKP